MSRIIFEGAKGEDTLTGELPLSFPDTVFTDWIGGVNHFSKWNMASIPIILMYISNLYK